jgi:hypothetical protein
MIVTGLATPRFGMRDARQDKKKFKPHHPVGVPYKPLQHARRLLG